MNSNIRRFGIVVTGLLAMGATSMAFAGVSAESFQILRDRAAAQQAAAPAPAPPRAQPAPAPVQQAPAPAQRQAAPRQNPPRQNAPRENTARSESRAGPPGDRRPPAVRQQSRVAQSSDPASSNFRSGGSDTRRNDARSPGRSNDNRAADRGNRGVMGESLSRSLRNADRGNADRNRGNYRGDHRRSPRVVQRLPHGYRNYNWNGRPYYNHGGSWYRPYGSSFIAIGAPYGLFVSTLPGYSSSFYYGSTRYYLYDDTYYTYEPVRRGYVVAPSPYEEEQDSYYEDALDEDIYVYPASGQSEQQQSDDRYECHRWAVDETDYDPIDDDYDADARAEYVRAMTACLTGRGYSVR